MDVSALHSLELEGPGPLRYIRAGEVATLPEPALMPLGAVVAALRGPTDFAVALEVPDMPVGSLRALWTAWRLHHGLPLGADLDRLLYLLKTYRGELEYDLLRHLPGAPPLGELFAGRKFRLLLNLIDRLPSNTYYVQAVTTDPEHARLLVRAQEKAEAAGQAAPKGPARAWWSEEAEQLAGIRDAINALTQVTMKAAGAKNLPKVEPTPRPGTMLGKVKSQERWAKHKSLVARVLPNKD